MQGDPLSCVILYVPHSSRIIPGEVRANIVIDDAEIESELNEMTDTKTDQLAFIAQRQSTLKPWIFMNTLSRLVIDPERFPDEREVMNSVGMGAVYTRTSRGNLLRQEPFTGTNILIDTYFTPYSDAFTELVTSRLDALGRVTIIDVHSYRTLQHPNSINHDQERPEICIGTDSFHTPENLIQSAQEACTAVGRTELNQPYAGTYIPLKFYGVDPRVQSIMMEIRADTFVDENLELSDSHTHVAHALVSLVNLV